MNISSEGVRLANTTNQPIKTRTQEGDAADLVSECADSVREIIERLSKVASSVSLTNYASKLHNELEERVKKLVKPFKGKDPQNSEYLTLMSIETVLPDLVIGTALWAERVTQEELLQEIEKGLRELEKSLRSAESEMKLKEKLVSYAQELANSIDRVRESTVWKSADEKPCCRDRDRETLLKTREFLSQQIDERSHQIWTLGSLFVPISFLILATTTTGLNVDFFKGMLLAATSLTCYSAWFIMYLRMGMLNSLSYPLIHSLELMLGISGHLALNELRQKERILQLKQEVFKIALNILIVLWTIFLVRFTVAIDDTLLFAAVMLTLLLSVFGTLKLAKEERKDNKWMVVPTALNAVIIFLSWQVSILL